MTVDRVLNEMFAGKGTTKVSQNCGLSDRAHCGGGCGGKGGQQGGGWRGQSGGKGGRNLVALLSISPGVFPPPCPSVFYLLLWHRDRGGGVLSLHLVPSEVWFLVVFQVLPSIRI